MQGVPLNLTRAQRSICAQLRFGFLLLAQLDVVI